VRNRAARSRAIARRPAAARAVLHATAPPSRATALRPLPPERPCEPDASTCVHGSSPV